MNKYNTTKIYLITNCYNNPNKVYVGKTKSTRESNHRNKFGEMILYTIIDEIDSLYRKDWEPLESYWIEQFKQWGFDVQNKNKGGGGPEYHSVESRLRMLGHKKPQSEEHKQKIGNSKRGKPNFKLVGKQHSDKSKLKQSSSLLGREVTWGMKIGNSKRGKSISKPINFNKNRKITWNDKISKSLLGKKKSNEHKLNMSNPITQYDLQGNFIREWPSKTSILLSKTISNGILSKNLKNITTKSTKFIWKYKEK